ncbi:Protein METHYLENE BLUE SENSITIVITY 1 [Orobanche hederae]
MTGKAKPKKHTAKEIKAKEDAALTNRGGGKDGLRDRTGQGKGGHAKFECPHCKLTAPDIKSMQIHHDAKHDKILFDDSKVKNVHAISEAESSKGPKPGVRGSLKK